jgi:hypothetical protein
MFVFHHIHLGSSIPTNKYGPKPKVQAAKPQETRVPPQSRVIITGKKFLSLNVFANL